MNTRRRRLARHRRKMRRHGWHPHQDDMLRAHFRRAHRAGQFTSPTPKEKP